MVNKKLLRKVEGKHHDRKPRATRQKAEQDVLKWLREQGAVESVKYDEDTGQPYRAFTIDLTK